jgi:hypothetical protein
MLLLWKVAAAREAVGRSPQRRTLRISSGEFIQSLVGDGAGVLARIHGGFGFLPRLSVSSASSA